MNSDRDGEPYAPLRLDAELYLVESPCLRNGYVEAVDVEVEVAVCIGIAPSLQSLLRFLDTQLPSLSILRFF